MHVSAEDGPSFVDGEHLLGSCFAYDPLKPEQIEFREKDLRGDFRLVRYFVLAVRWRFER